MSLFKNTLKQIEKASKLMDLDPEIEEILSKPQKIIEVDVKVEMGNGKFEIFKGFRVQHNNFAGPYKGGIRYHEQVDMEEVKALSVWMTLKCSVMGLPLGGAKGGVVVNPKNLSEKELENLSRSYIREIASFIGPDKDVPAPDVNTNPRIMCWFADEYSKIVGKDTPGVVTGKPVDKGGSEGRDTATAQGGVYIIEKLMEEHKLDPGGTKVVVQGFGNAGGTVARILAESGYDIVGVSDSKGGIVCNYGIDPHGVMECKIEKRTVRECGVHATELHGKEGASCSMVSNEELLEQECDLLILAAMENQIHEGNAERIKAKFVVELANGPVSPEADEILKKNGIVVVPDILANAGGVTVSYFEMIQNAKNEHWSREEVNKKLKKYMTEAWKNVEKNAKKHSSTLREAAFITALEKLALFL